MFNLSPTRWEGSINFDSISEKVRHKSTTIEMVLEMPSKVPPKNINGKNAAIVVKRPIVEGIATLWVPLTTVSTEAVYWFK